MISYADLLQRFWSWHNPCGDPYSRQYRSAVFAHDAAQREQAEKSRIEQQRLQGQPVLTAIEGAGSFYPAEDYHQKYYLTQVPGLFAETQAIYPQPARWTRSTAVARINGIVGGYGEPAHVEQELESYGLSAAGQAKLRGYLRR